MVNEIRVYAEGGGDRAQTKASLREGLSVFLDPIRQAARTHRIPWRLTVCGGREAAYRAFISARRMHRDAHNILLVDSEGVLAAGHTPWQHLQTRDGWDRGDAADDQCHLMVQAMEAWFIADVNALAEYFGQGFHENHIPGTPNVENIEKDRLERILDQAARDTNKEGYHKIRDGSALLQRIDREIVKQKAPHCRRLFDSLMAVVQP